MSEIFCDIVPHQAGWVFVSKGVQSPAYPCYHMAVEAALQQAADAAPASRDFVLRRQDLKGRMHRVADENEADPRLEEVGIAH